MKEGGGAALAQSNDRAGRRAAIAEAAIAILGEHGSRALTHRAIDKYLGYPEGTTSAYFRRREDLLMATVRILFDADFARIRTLFDTLLARDAVDAALVARWFADMVTAVRKEQHPSRMLARYECFLMAKRQPEADSLLHDLFVLRAEKTAEVFRRLGAQNPTLAALQFELMLRGIFLTAAFVPKILDDALADEGFFLREISAAMLA